MKYLYGIDIGGTTVKMGQKTTTNRMKIYSFRILQIEIFYLFLSKCFP